MWRSWRILLLAAVLAGPTLVIAGSGLADFVRLLGFADPQGVVEAVETVRATGRLPDHYLRKDEARHLGWRPGRDLCDVAPDGVIGGDRFFNREGRLPDRPARRWYEADLDFACGRRGARRLVFSNDGLVYVTLDHYATFIEVPE